MNTMIKRVMYVVLGCSLALLFAGRANAGICPATGSATDCGIQINITGASTYTVTLGPAGNGNPYDGTEDTLVGITNTTGATINSITITSSSGAFGFDSDGACSLPYDPSACGSATGYEGPITSFSNNTGTSLTLTFAGGLGAGASTWFSLEGSPSQVISGNAPEPASLMLLGTGLVGFFLRRRSA